MDVPALGAGPTGAALSSAIGGLAGPKARMLAAIESVTQPGDTTNAILNQLSEPAILKLLEIIDRPLSPENAARLEGLLRASMAAASDGKTQEALSSLAEFAALDPRRAEKLESEPGVTTIRQEVRQLVSYLTTATRLDAESRLGRATQLLETLGFKLISQDFSTETAIIFAGRFLEAGGYANCKRSVELSQMAIDMYAFPSVLLPVSLALDSGAKTGSAPASSRPRRQWVPHLRKLWRRAPLLVLLLTWLALGIVGGSISVVWRNYWPFSWPQSLANLGFDVWGLGFPALVGFGFYMRVRNGRR